MTDLTDFTHHVHTEAFEKGRTSAFARPDDYNRFKVALDIQDAGNLRAIAREFVKVVDAAMEETQSTKATWADAAVVLLVNKMESLSRSEAPNVYSRAYEICHARKEEVHGQ